MSDYVELTGDLLPPHLRPDAPTAECCCCHRTTWSEFGERCNFLQPDGTNCAGWFHPLEHVT